MNLHFLLSLPLCLQDKRAVTGITLAVTKYNNIVRCLPTMSFHWMCAWEEYKKILAGFPSTFQKNVCHLSVSYLSVICQFYSILILFLLDVFFHLLLQLLVIGSVSASWDQAQFLR